MLGVRGHNEGSLYQRADGRWVAAISLGDGRRASRYAKSRAEARTRLAELQRLKDAQAIEGSRLTLGRYLERWLDEVRPRLAPATWRKHEQHVRLHVIPRLGHVRLSELSVSHCRDLQRWLVDDLDAQSVRHVRATLRRALADALREGLVQRNVAALAEPPRLDRRERPILTADQVRTLIDGTRGDRLHALWVLLATTGLREAEALGLTWKDVDLGRADEAVPVVRLATRNQDEGLGAAGTPSIQVRHTLHRIDGQWQLREPKTPKSRRTVFLPPVTVEALRIHRTKQAEEWLAAGRPGEMGLVFVRPDGRPYHGSKLTTLLYPVLDRLGLPRVHIHDLRHSAATILYGAGVPLEAIADMLGHSTVRVTQDLYRHRVEHVQREAADAMQRAIG